MSKSHRVSVPLTPEIERQLRRMSAGNGRSIAANFAALASAGAEQMTLDAQFAELKCALSGEQKTAEILAEIRSEFAKLRGEIERVRSTSGAEKQLSDGVFIPENPARLLFGEALFSAALSAQILNAELPGNPPKPAGFHIRTAREKANVQLVEMLASLGGEQCVDAR